nr:cytochrome P450 6HW28 [Pagiophloeus tsushimanus]
MEYLLLSVNVLIGLITLIYLYSKWKHSYWKRKGVPQLQPEFFYGDARGMMKGEMSMAETFLDIYKKFRAAGAKYGGAYAVFGPSFVPIAPEVIKDVMQKNFECFTAHFPMNPTSIFTRGLFHLKGDSWRQTRKQLTPTFTSGKMKMMFDTMLEKTTGLGTLAGEFAQSGEPVNVKEVLERFTSDVVGSCGFGIDCNSLNDPNSEFLKYGRMIFDPPSKKENYWGLFLRALGIRGMRRAHTEVENFFKKIVGQTIDFREKNDIYRKDFMHLMIQLKNRGEVTDDGQIFSKNGKLVNATTFDEDNITAQCLLFYIAGFETSATTMTFALLELAQHQEIQEKVRQEAKDVLKKHNGKMTYEAMMELVYTEMVIEETLRKYPPVAAIPRVCTRNYTIPGTDIVIEKGTMTHIPAWGLHKDSEYFPDPEKFDPERFNEENKKNIKDFTYIPFGEGPRMCLGLRFGMMQSKVGLVSLVSNYNFTLSKKTALPLKMQRNSFITTATGGIWVNITKV